ncbi:MAG TPA: hypothetical protein VGP40_01335, partial [Chthoniobacterales bacterium]|nr:hypothetical protein [Chthoniobacterales bacterium]
MAIPFLSYFKKKPKAEAAPVALPEKKSSDRLSKTVMPNATRAAAASPQSTPAPAPAYAQTAAAPPSVAPPMIPRTVAFGGISQTRASDLPPAVALALEPNVERTISLELAEIVSQMPPGLVRPLEDGDADRRVLLKASELERGMANGKPAVSIASVYQQVPEIFVREIAAGDP